MDAVFAGATVSEADKMDVCFKDICYSVQVEAPGAKPMFLVEKLVELARTGQWGNPKITKPILTKVNGIFKVGEIVLMNWLVE